jgi:rhodanese-related sulfurtransferase
MVQELTPAELKGLWDRGARPFVLDVREDWELATARIDPVTHIPMQQVPERLADLPPKGLIVVMCRSGGRSLQVARFLERNGYAEVANLSGGILAWHADVDPNIPTY